ncbi:MAG: hypothetical protein ACPG1A_17405 [Halioglobus sp.]
MARQYLNKYTWDDDAILNGDTTADRDFTTIDCRGLAAVFLELILVATGALAGTVYLEWSMDGTTWYPFAIDTGKYSTIDTGGHLTVTEASGSIAITALTAAARFSLGIDRPPAYMRFRLDWTSGGDAAGATGKMNGTAQ